MHIVKVKHKGNECECQEPAQKNKNLGFRKERQKGMNMVDRETPACVLIKEGIFKK